MSPPVPAGHGRVFVAIAPAPPLIPTLLGAVPLVLPAHSSPAHGSLQARDLASVARSGVVAGAGRIARPWPVQRQ